MAHQEVSPGAGSYLADVVVDGVRVRIVDRVAHVVEEAVLVCVQLRHGDVVPWVLGAIGRERLGRKHVKHTLFKHTCSHGNELGYT